jgi:hypothetical protein
VGRAVLGAALGQTGRVARLAERAVHVLPSVVLAPSAAARVRAATAAARRRVHAAAAVVFGALPIAVVAPAGRGPAQGEHGRAEEREEETPARGRRGIDFGVGCRTVHEAR